MPDTYNIFGTKANNLDAFVGSIPDAQLIIVPDPVTGKLFRSTFGQLKADVILAFGDLSYLDQIIEVPQVANLPQPGEVKKIYVITGAGPDQNKQFRWGGSIYVEFPAGSGDVAGEAIIRGNADANLQSQIDAEITNRQNAYAGLQTNITNEATARANADTLLSQQIASEKNSRTTNDNILQGLINAEGATRLTADNALSARIDTKVEQITGMGLSSNDFTTDEKTKLAGLEGPKWKGTYLNKAALDAANVGEEGASADVDAGAGQDVARYIWDNNDNKWVLQQGASTAETAASIKTKYESNPDTNAYTDAEKTKLSGIEAGAQVNPLTTDSLPEGSVNLYFTENRVRSTVLTGLSTATGGDIIATDSILAAFGRIQNRFNTYLSNFNGANQLVKLDAAGKLPALDGSLLINLPGGSGDGGPIYSTASGSNAYTATIEGLSSLETGRLYIINFVSGSSSSINTLNINSFGAVPIKIGTTNAGKNLISQNTTIALLYDGSSFQITGASLGNVAYLNTGQSFTGNNTFNGNVCITGKLFTSVVDYKSNLFLPSGGDNAQLDSSISLTGRNIWARVLLGNGQYHTSATNNTDIAAVVITNGVVSASYPGNTYPLVSSLMVQKPGTPNGTVTDCQAAYFDDAPTGGVSNWSINAGRSKFRAGVTIESTTEGFLQPRMTATDWSSIASKAEGLQAWNNSDHGQMWYDGTRSIGFRFNGTKFQGYNGTSWVDLN